MERNSSGCCIPRVRKRLQSCAMALQPPRMLASLLILRMHYKNQGIGIFRFDFSGNGESGGEFQYANYRKEADDLHSVVLYLYQEKYDVKAVVGHSKGGDVVVLYASLYHDIQLVVNLSGRFYMGKGVEERLRERIY